MKKIIASGAVIIIILAAVFVTFISMPNSAYAESDALAFSVNQDLVASNTDFGLDIFKELVQDEDSGENIFISPFSISTALAMTYMGSDTTTREAMAETLNFDDFTMEELQEEYQKLIGSLENADSQVTLNIANSIWISQVFEEAIKDSFIDIVEYYYDAGIFVRDFSSPQTITEINGWISQKTNGMIDDMIEEIGDTITMFLINAIYFKGDWVTQFDKDLTEAASFYLSDGSDVSVDMMSTEGGFNYSYYVDDNLQVARLPYGRDKIAMYVFLPDDGNDLNAFVNNLDRAEMESYIQNLGPERELLIKMPKFDIEYGKKRLNDALNNMGMGIAFNPGADFSGMSLINLMISYVDHKAVIKVNEEGTEAAAVTVVAIEITAEIPDIMEVNKPFFFVIRDDRSGTILFMGKVMDPS